MQLFFSFYLVFITLHVSDAVCVHHQIKRKKVASRWYLYNQYYYDARYHEHTKKLNRKFATNDRLTICSLSYTSNLQFITICDIQCTQFHLTALVTGKYTCIVCVTVYIPYTLRLSLAIFRENQAQRKAFLCT